MPSWLSEYWKISERGAWTVYECEYLIFFHLGRIFIGLNHEGRIMFMDDIPMTDWRPVAIPETYSTFEVAAAWPESIDWIPGLREEIMCARL